MNVVILNRNALRERCDVVMTEFSWLIFIAIIGVIIITSLLQIFLNRKWKLVYTAFGQENYFKITAKLNENGVKYKTKIPPNGFRERSFNDNTQYDIYVKKEKSHLAARAIQK